LSFFNILPQNSNKLHFLFNIFVDNQKETEYNFCGGVEMKEENFVNYILSSTLFPVKKKETPSGRKVFPAFTEC